MGDGRIFRQHTLWAIPHKERLATLHASACKFPVIFHKNAREYIKYSLRFVSSDEKFDDASVAQSLCGIALAYNATLTICANRTDSRFFADDRMIGGAPPEFYKLYRNPAKQFLNIIAISDENVKLVKIGRFFDRFVKIVKSGEIAWFFDISHRSCTCLQTETEKFFVTESRTLKLCKQFRQYRGRRRGIGERKA
ncbi:MAG: hypothetical protein ACLSFT_04980 [Ruminococcus callidus]